MTHCLQVWYAPWPENAKHVQQHQCELEGEHDSAHHCGCGAEWLDQIYMAVVRQPRPTGYNLDTLEARRNAACARTLAEPGRIESVTAYGRKAIIVGLMLHGELWCWTKLSTN